MQYIINKFEDKGVFNCTEKKVKKEVHLIGAFNDGKEYQFIKCKHDKKLN